MFALNTVAQIPDLNDFLKGLQIVLKPDGVAIFEFPDLVTTINGTQFDTIYHEHYSYLSVTALNSALHRVGMGIFDVEHLKTHGGSLRVFIKHWNAEVSSESASVGDQIDAELALDYDAFVQRVDRARREFVQFLAVAHFTGKTIYGYGAAARGNTFLNYCSAELLALGGRRRGERREGRHVHAGDEESTSSARRSSSRRSPTTS